jgi:hypothetical protein
VYFHTNTLLAAVFFLQKRSLSAVRSVRGGNLLNVRFAPKADVSELCARHAVSRGAATEVAAARGSTLDKGQQVGVDGLCMGGDHAVRKILVSLQYAVFQ